MAVHTVNAASFCKLATSTRILSLLLASLTASCLLAGVLFPAHASAAPSSSFPSLGDSANIRHSLRVARAVADATKLTEDERNQFINELVMAELSRRNAFLRGLLTMEPLKNAPLSQEYKNGGGFGGGGGAAITAQQSGDFQRIARDDERGNVGASNKWDVLSRAMPRFG